MSVEIWLAFVAASAVLLALPGPTIMLVVSYALADGRRTALSTVPGVAAGDLTAMTLSFLGLGAVLSTSSAAFTALKWLGAAYLVWLGIRMWRADPVPEGLPRTTPAASGRAMLAHAFAVTALNPKGIVFFIAFVPQFITPRQAALPQMVVLGATFLALAVANATLYALLAGGVRASVRRPSVLRLVNRIGGSILIGAGLLTAAIRRGA